MIFYTIFRLLCFMCFSLVFTLLIHLIFCSHHDFICLISVPVHSVCLCALKFNAPLFHQTVSVDLFCGYFGHFSLWAQQQQQDHLFVMCVLCAFAYLLLCSHPYVWTFEFFCGFHLLSFRLPLFTVCLCVHLCLCVSVCEHGHTHLYCIF